MSIKITDACINCGACEPECPNNAIYEGGVAWRYADGTQLKEVKKNNQIIDANEEQQPISEEFYYIVADKCTECVGFYDTPQCAAVCPVDCCVPDLANQESQESLLNKQTWLHEK
jgi:ferredoxin